MGGEALGIAKIICPVQGYARARKQEWVWVGEQSGGGVYRGLLG